jgi:hypothetical protein
MTELFKDVLGTVYNQFNTQTILFVYLLIVSSHLRLRLLIILLRSIHITFYTFLCHPVHVTFYHILLDLIARIMFHEYYKL